MAGQPETAATIVEARWVIPADPPQAVLQGHAVVIAGGRIRELLPAEQARTRYPGARRIELAGHALIPGLINLHTHAAMTLMRGLADDRALMDWLQNHVWPVELKLVSPEFVHDGTLLACAEMLRGGVTCFNDMYFFPEAAAEATLAAGMRAALGMIVIEFPSPYAADAGDYLSKGLAARDAFKHEPLLTFCLAPHAPYTVSDAAFGRVATYAGELDVPVHIHLHETADEIRESVAAHQLRPIRRLQQLGLLGPNFIAVHAVHLADDEIELLADHGCHVAHCPSSNLKLASGIAPVARLAGRGVNIGLGTDGAASNNRLDVFAEMRLAALLAKGVSGEATALPAHAVLGMATLNAARALGIADRVGSLAPGKCADMTAVNLEAPELAPCYDPLSHLVYAAGREHVSHVWVNGELLVENGRLSRLDPGELVAKAAYWKEKIRSLA
ncbi:MAG: TRZ/ATZ family hydrolase [Betaproteobacteria bacterium]|nr:TRZ/ATZ family hydrolase [Betaproteobacteria bacterium]MBI2509594.1 TRZ/ATZ family hydrolase [Betaproteobacteria bacterium]